MFSARARRFSWGHSLNEEIRCTRRPHQATALVHSRQATCITSVHSNWRTDCWSGLLAAWCRLSKPSSVTFTKCSRSFWRRGQFALPASLLLVLMLQLRLPPTQVEKTRPPQKDDPRVTWHRKDVTIAREKSLAREGRKKRFSSTTGHWQRERARF